MPYQIGGRHVSESVYDADRPVFLKRELMGFGVDGTSTSEFMVIQMNQCPFICFKII